jgi:uncharacterized membrane protein
VARYERPTSDFERVGNFSDAVFAIAMTLLVVGIGVPQLANPAELGEALRGLQPEILSFFISFAVVGFYWRGHHAAFARLKAVDSGYITLNLAHLGVIAFIPFPTALVGTYEDDPVAFVLYAVTLAVASLLDTLLFVVASRHDLLAVPLPASSMPWAMAAQLAPVAVFLLSIPVAVFWSTTVALWSWPLIFVIEVVIDQIEPPAVRAASE